MEIKEKLLIALETEKKGDWNKAHEIVQDMKHPYAYWIHAYLHRKEPDLSNASYWYSRAGKPMPDYSYEKEWKEIYEVIGKMQKDGRERTEDRRRMTEDWRRGNQKPVTRIL